MLEVLPFVEDPDLSGSAAPALPQLLPPWVQIQKSMNANTNTKKYEQKCKYKMYEHKYKYNHKV